MRLSPNLRVVLPGAQPRSWTMYGGLHQGIADQPVDTCLVLRRAAQPVSRRVRDHLQNGSAVLDRQRVDTDPVAELGRSDMPRLALLVDDAGQVKKCGGAAILTQDDRGIVDAVTVEVAERDVLDESDEDLACLRDLKEPAVGEPELPAKPVRLVLGVPQHLQRQGGLLFEVDAVDPLTFLGAPLVLRAAALLAAYLPARRASRVHPVAALRTD